MKIKEYLLIPFVLLAGCGVSQVKETKVVERAQSTKFIRNINCLESNKFEIQSINNEGVIAKLCPSKFKDIYDDAFDACYDSPEIFLPVAADKNNYVDEQKVSLPEEQCLFSDGVYEVSDPYYKSMGKVLERAMKVRTGENIKLPNNSKRIRRVKLGHSKTQNPYYIND